MSVKLTEVQMEVIKTFLDRMELKQLDLRSEVFDHMVTATENYMDKSFSFEEASKMVAEDWLPELRSHHSYWIGLLWTGPKILIDKTVQHTKKAYLNILLITLPFSLLFLFVSDSLFSTTMVAIINSFVGIMFGIILLFLLYFHFQMEKTKIHSTYRFLFKVQAVGFGFAYFIYNPFLGFMQLSAENNKDNWIPLTFYISAMVYYHWFHKWYRAHMALQKVKLA